MDAPRISRREHTDLLEALDRGALILPASDRAGLTLLKGYRDGWWLTLVPFISRCVRRHGEIATSATVLWRAIPQLFVGLSQPYFGPRDQGALLFAADLGLNRFELTTFPARDVAAVMDAILDATTAARPSH